MNNFIVLNDNQRKNDKEIFFCDEDVQFIPISFDMYDVLVKCGIFKTKNQARKNWKRTGQEIPEGFTVFEKVGKFKKTITILNVK